MSVKKSVEKLKKRVCDYLEKTGMNKTDLGKHIRRNGNTVNRLMADKLTLPNIYAVEEWLDTKKGRK